MDLVLAAGDHGHLDLGVSVGSLALRVVLLAAVPVVAGFVLLRGFLAEPGRSTTVAVMGVAAGAASMELLLAGGLNLPEQVVPLLLAGLALPMYLVLSKDERFATAVGLGRRLAPWVFWPAAALAVVQLVIAWSAGAGPDRTATVLHTGVLLALVALVWFAVATTRDRRAVLGMRVGAAVLAVATLASTAQAVVLRPPEPIPGMATAARLELGPSRVDALVVPNLPGWNLVHIGSATASVGTSEDQLTPARPRPGTTGGWLAIHLPPGRSDLWVRDAAGVDSFTTDTGGGEPAPASLTGADGPECASALLGRMLASGTAQGVRCPAESLHPRDADALRETVIALAAAGHRELAMATDGSARSAAAVRTVGDAALAEGIAVVRPGPATPLVLVNGWTGAAATLAGVADGSLAADGTYLAPWLFTGPLLAPAAGQHVAQRFDPADEPFRRYGAELREDYPTQPVSASGYRAWLTERLQPETGDLRLRPADPTRVVLAGGPG